MPAITISVLNSAGDVLSFASGIDETWLVYEGEYTPGDQLSVHCEQSDQFLILRLDDGLPPAFVYCKGEDCTYQLCDDLNRGRLQEVTDFLMIPEYLLWKLTGTKAKEYTNATTTGLVSAQTGAFDSELTKQLRLPDHLFPPLRQPGTPVGAYKGIKAVLCATHDTASAVEGIPMEGNQPYL